MDAKQMRRRLRETGQRMGISTEPEYDRAAGVWEWEWTDGPATDEVAVALGDAAWRVRLHRRLSPRSAALAVVVEALGGTETTAAPDARTSALADALAATAPAHGADDPVWLRRRLRELGGLPALLHPYTADEADPLAMTAREHLTAVYGTAGDYQAREAWSRHLRTAEDAPALARKALADPDADRSSRLAAVAMLGELRADLERLELTAMDRAVEAGASYTDLGRALGVARQVAHRRHTRRRDAHPTRLSPQQ